MKERRGGKKIESDINALSVACLQTNHSFFFIQSPRRHCSDLRPEFAVPEYSGISGRENYKGFSSIRNPLFLYKGSFNSHLRSANRT